MNKNDITLFGALGGGFVGAIIVSKTVADPTWNAALTILCVLVGFLVPILQDPIMEAMAAKYTYLAMTTRPSDQAYPVWIVRATCEKIADGLYATTLQLGKALKIAPYGKFKAFVINSKMPWESMMRYRQGKALFEGYEITHRAVARITVDEFEEGSFDLDHAAPIPVFYIREAPNMKPSVTLTPDQLGKKGISFDALVQKIQNLNMQLAEKTREAMHWHQRAVHMEEIVAHLKNEIQSLLKTIATITKVAIEWLLAVQKAELTIDNAIKSLTPSRFDTKWIKPLAIAAVPIVIVAYIWANPKAMQQLQYFLQSPINMALVALMVIAPAGVAVWYIMKRRG